MPTFIPATWTFFLTLFGMPRASAVIHLGRFEPSYLELSLVTEARNEQQYIDDQHQTRLFGASIQNRQRTKRAAAVRPL